MRKIFWRAALHFIRQVGALDINEQLFRENEYLQAELQVLKAQLKKNKKRLRFTNEQRKLLAKKGKVLSSRLYEVVSIVTPATILRWHRQLVAKKFDSSQSPCKIGRPKTSEEIVALIVNIALDNPSCGYPRIAGAVNNLGITISRNTVASILKDKDINPSDDRDHGGMSWADFIRIHKDVI